jgi:hypothetical protein
MEGDIALELWPWALGPHLSLTTPFLLASPHRMDRAGTEAILKAVAQASQRAEAGLSSSGQSAQFPNWQEVLPPLLRNWRWQGFFLFACACAGWRCEAHVHASVEGACWPAKAVGNSYASVDAN